jgi:hypothetical protein
LTLFKKPPNEELSARKKAYNVIFNRKRVDIEQYFGLLKLRFSMFRCGYCGPLKHLLTLFCLACTFTNKSLDRDRLTDINCRNTLMLERSLNREFKDKPFELVGDVAQLPEFERRERRSGVVYCYTPCQNEDEE